MSVILSICINEWNYCINRKIVTIEEADIMKDQIRYIVTGLLLFYINRIHPDTYTKFIDTIDIQLNNILDKRLE